MGVDKAFVKVGGVPLWQRQLTILKELAPAQLFISGPPHVEWHDERCLIVPDTQPDAGPLAGLVAAMRETSTSLLLTLAIDLPNMTAHCLRGLLARCSATRGIIPRTGELFEPVAAVYPTTALPLAESCLASRDYSLQKFAVRCVAEGLLLTARIATEEEPLFLNMNTPEDLLALTNA